MDCESHGNRHDSNTGITSDRWSPLSLRYSWMTFPMSICSAPFPSLYFSTELVSAILRSSTRSPRFIFSPLSMHDFIDTLLKMFGAIDYWAIFFLMAMESSILPVPSELVMIPAWYNAAQWLINPVLAILMGWLGSLFWALINYYVLWVLIWKPFLMKYGKYILITPEKYHRAESLFLRSDRLYTFLWRLIPVVRHLISIPAGIFRMKLLPFCVITFIGATLWCAILVGIGYYFWDAMVVIVKEYTHWVGIGSVILIGIWLYWKVWRKGKNSSSRNASDATHREEERGSDS